SPRAACCCSDAPPGEATTDPCDFAREIASQPPCLASGDCESLQLWERAFGLPRFEPLDPARPAGLSLAVDRRRWERWRGAAPRTSRPVNPFAFCPAGDDPRR
ncbi:MAG: hypothetical protein ACE5EG_10165, partial [Thermoanaerobaculia bacterium]